VQLKTEKKDNIDVYSAQMISLIKSGSFLIEALNNDQVILEVMELIKRLFCSQSESQDAYCKQCNDCTMLEKGTHPDLYWLGADSTASTIKIEDIRLLKERVNVKPFQAAKKVFIIQNAERLSPAAANALLKTLEEPPEQVILILITQSISRLLPTVISRCKRIRFSAGNVQADEFAEKYQMLKAFFAKNDLQVQKQLYEDIANIERHQVAELLQDLVFVFRDMLMIKLGIDPVDFMSSEPVESIRQLAEHFSATSIQIIIDEIMRTRYIINTNANIKLSIDLLIKAINKNSFDL
jgi:DNA polymerase-3 subunit delta'